MTKEKIKEYRDRICKTQRGLEPDWAKVAGERYGILLDFINEVEKDPQPSIPGLDCKEIEKRHKLLATHDDAEELFQYIIATLKKQKRWVVMQDWELGKCNHWRKVDIANGVIHGGYYCTKAKAKAECGRLNDGEKEVEKSLEESELRKINCFITAIEDFKQHYNWDLIKDAILNALNKKEQEDNDEG